MSDGTHLTNFSGDKKAWPIYMTIGNLSAEARMKHSLHSVVLVALLPIPIKMRDIPLGRRNAQRERNRMVSQHVLHHVMKPILNPESRRFHARCADGNFRRCYATIAAWMADYPEHRDLHNLKNGVCYWCECPPNEMGDLPKRQEERHQLRDHNAYRVLSDENTRQSITQLKERNVNAGFNILWYLDCIVCDLPKPDLLHTMQIGMLKHLLAWLHEFLKQYKRLERFNDIWLSVPAYLDMSKPKRAYEEVSRWNGGEIKTMTRFLVGVLRNALRDPEPSQRSIFDRAIQCTRALVEFYFYCQYDSHDEETLDLMENALRRFHDYKDVFRQFRAGKRLTAEAKHKRKELCDERDAELEESKYKSSAARERIRDAWKAIIADEMARYVEEGSDFNFPKIHLMMHFRENIQRYGSLKQWSTEIGESSHKKQIKDGFNASNKTGDYYTQMIEYYLRSDAFAVRKANLEASNRKKHAGEMSGTLQVHSRKRLDPRLLKFISPQMHKGKERVKDFRALLQTITNSRLRDDLHAATRRFLLSKHISIDSEDLLNSTASIYHGMEIGVSNTHGESIVQRLRCTGEKSWYAGSARLDWAWVQTAQHRQGHELPYKALRGCLPYRMLLLFKLQAIHSAGSNTYWLAYVQLTKPANGGVLERASQMVRVVKPSHSVARAVVSAGNIMGAAHLIPEEPNSSPEECKGWVVNSHIDFATWNNVDYL